MKYTSGDISNLLSATLVGAPDHIVSHISIDSRSLSTHISKTIFIALAGNIVDGHNYVQAAYDVGIRVFLIDKKVKLPSDAITIKVNNTLKSLQKWAAIHRAKFNIPVIAITGSNGKTITKEWLSQLLSKHYNVVKSPKSYNSQIGVPVSVLLMDDTHEVAVFEAGISQPNEMKYLEEIIKPTICVLTNIGDAHSSGFEGEGLINLESKLKEKSILFRDCKELIYYSGEGSVPNVIDALKHIKKNENHRPYSYEILDDGTVKFSFYGKLMNLQLPFTDEASIQNILASISVMCLLGIDITNIEKDLKLLDRLQMRMETKAGRWNSTLINDAYNSDLQSLNNAVQYLKQIKAKKPLIILSDLEDNQSDDLLYIKVAEILNRMDHTLITVGGASQRLEKLVPAHTEHYSDTEEVQITRSITEGRTILFKGARKFKFEKLYKRLSVQSHSAYLEIDLSAMEHNLSVYASIIPNDTKIMTVVKASAYGSGARELAKHLQHRQVAYMAVAYVDEGIQLREADIHTPILVLNPDLDQLDEMVKHQLEPEVYDIVQLQHIITHTDCSLPIHLKLDTGMHRLGFKQEDLSELCDLLFTSIIKVATVFSHLAASDEPLHNDYTQKQIALYDEMCNQIGSVIGYTPIRHIANTAAISRFPHAHYDMVRLGLGLYGIDGNPKTASRLERVHSLNAKIIQIKLLSGGDTVGYNLTHTLERDSRIAIINIGYADGLMRSSGNGKHKVYLHGRYVPIIGNVCMDLTIIDITDVSAAQVGDVVEIFGKKVDITSLAKINNTIPYELLAGMSTRVKKVYVRS